jgi:hypothetical protein
VDVSRSGAGPTPAQPALVPRTLPQPDSGFALRLNEQDYVEIKDSREVLDPRRPFTVEAWLRFYPHAREYWIAGNHVHRSLLRENLPGNEQVGGWKVDCLNLFGKPEFGFSTKTSSHRAAPDTGYVWRHVAACGDGSTTSVFVDGQHIASHPAQILRYAPSPLNVHLGRMRFPAHMLAGGEIMIGKRYPWIMDLRAFRISRTARYRGDFEPAPSFESDAATEVFLDFSQRDGQTIPDRSGKNHDGLLSGGTWIRLPENSLPFSGGPLALRFSPGQRAEILVKSTSGSAFFGNGFTAEMWCRWTATETEMEWLSGGPVRSNLEGSWSLRAVNAEDGVALKMTCIGPKGERLESPPAVIPVDDRWRHVAVCGTREKTVLVVLDGRLLIKLEHGLDESRGSPSLIHLGSTDAARDNGRLEVRSFRVSSGSIYAGTTLAPTIPPALLVDNAGVVALLDFSRARNAFLPDLSERGTGAARLYGGTWFDWNTGDLVVDVGRGE